MKIVNDHLSSCVAAFSSAPARGVGETRAKQFEIGNQARALLEQVDDRDCLEQPDMKGIASDGFASLQRFRRQSPSVPVGRGEDGRLQVGAQVVPKPVRAIQCFPEGYGSGSPENREARMN